MKLEFNEILKLVDRIGAWVVVAIATGKDSRDKSYGEHSEILKLIKEDREAERITSE